MSGQVGFNFQGDVFAGGSLVFSAAGRLMKLLSDVGVDAYAVGAVLQLGGELSISQHQEMVVAAAVAKRSNHRQGFLAQALSIGWGYNDTAYELSRTRVGSAALMLIDSFSAGITTYKAAEGLQELMSLRGCGQDLLPSVTVLKRLFDHVAPIMEDSGFRAIIDNIHMSSLVALSKERTRNDIAELRIALLRDTSASRDWAVAASQLLLSASRQETVYLNTESRGAWLAAFAVHVLRMTCTIFYESNIVWQAAGSEGSLVLQLGKSSGPPTQPFSVSLQLKEASPTLNVKPGITYLLKDALRTELALIPELSTKFHHNIVLSIVRTVGFLARSKLPGLNLPSTDYYRAIRTLQSYITGKFCLTTLIVTTFESLGIKLDFAEVESSHYQPHDIDWVYLGLSPCDRSQIFCDDVDPYDSFCCPAHNLGRIIEGASITILALLPCEIRFSEVRVSASVFSGRSFTRWGMALTRLFDPAVSQKEYPLTESEQYSYDAMLDHIVRLLDERMKDISVESAHVRSLWDISADCIGATARGSTVALKILFDEEAFTESGKYLAIYSGRVTAGAEFRDYMRQGRSHRYIPVFNESLQPWALAEGVQFTGADTNDFVRVSSTVTLEETAFRVTCTATSPKARLMDLDSSVEPFDPACCTSMLNFWSAVNKLLLAESAPPCRHQSSTAFSIPKLAGPSYICAAHCLTVTEPHYYVLLCSGGSKVKQLFAHEAACAGKPSQYWGGLIIRQGVSCLSCAFYYAKRLCDGSRGKWQGATIVCS